MGYHRGMKTLGDHLGSIRCSSCLRLQLFDVETFPLGSDLRPQGGQSYAFARQESGLWVSNRLRNIFFRYVLIIAGGRQTARGLTAPHRHNPSSHHLEHAIGTQHFEQTVDFIFGPGDLNGERFGSHIHNPRPKYTGQFQAHANAPRA